MANANDIVRGAKELQQGRQDVLDAVSDLGSGAKGLSSGLSDFLARPENLVALAICAVALVGIYRLLRSEHIIPAPSRPAVGSLLSGALGRSLLFRALAALVLGALGLALFTGRLAFLF
jgi:hypothetical protein